MYVNNSSFSFGATSFSITSSELSASNTLVSTYIYILESRTTLEEVISEAGLSYTYEDLEKMIDARAVSDTAAFDVTVESENPVEAELIANTIAKILPDRIAEIVDGSSVRIVDYALIGGILCSAVVLAMFVTSEKRNVDIRSVDDLKDMYPDIPVLALIPDMRISGKKGYYYSSYYGEGGDKQ